MSRCSHLVVVISGFSEQDPSFSGRVQPNVPYTPMYIISAGHRVVVVVNNLSLYTIMRFNACAGAHETYIRFTFKSYIRSHGDDTTHIRLAYYYYNHQGRRPPPRSRYIASTLFFFPGRKRREKGPPPNGYRVALLRPMRPGRMSYT